MPVAEPPGVKTVVSAKDIHVTFGNNHVLKGINFEIEPNEIVALLGPNGCGKSTLIRTLIGINPHSSGTVQLFGLPLGKATPWARIGYVPQVVSSQGGLSANVLEVVSSGLLAGKRVIRPKNYRELSLAALRSVGLEERAKNALHTLSIGQQQRVLIARAMVKSPDLLVLDEPLAGIDVSAQALLIQTLKDLKAKQDLTILVVLHEVGVFRELITRTMVMNNGNIIVDAAGALANHEQHHAHHPEASFAPHPLNAGIDLLGGEDYA